MDTSPIRFSILVSFCLFCASASDVRIIQQRNVVLSDLTACTGRELDSEKGIRKVVFVLLRALRRQFGLDLRVLFTAQLAPTTRLSVMLL